jgi:hypothetical protein
LIIYKDTGFLGKKISFKEVQVANEHMKKCSPSLSIKEMQIRAASLKFHLTPVRIIIIKKTTNAGDPVYKGPLYTDTVARNVSSRSHYQNQYEGYSTN